MCRLCGSVVQGIAATLLGQDGKFGQSRRGQSDALEALRDNAVRRRQQTDEKVYRSDGAALLAESAAESIAEQTNHVVGEELAVEVEWATRVALFLEEKL